MSKGLIVRAFIDKYTGLYHEPGKTVEFSDARLKELSAMGFVEVKDAPVKPETKEEPKAEPKVEPKKKSTTKKK